VSNADLTLNTERTQYEMTRRMFGIKYLGPLATLEEKAVGVWFEENGWKGRYAFQWPVGDFRNQLFTDFYLFGTAPQLCIEVNGDKWHGEIQQQAADRRRAIAIEQQGYLVIPVFGHDIVAYKGYPVPTDASFHRIMTFAVQAIALSKP
jgi:very-short-patch-repair endonuclease